MISSLTHDILYYGGIVGVLVGMFGAILSRPAGNPTVSRKKMLGFLGVMVASGLAVWWVAGYSTEVVLVTESDGHVSATRGMVRSIDDDLKHDASGGGSILHDDVWVLNRTSKELKLVTIQYGHAFGFDNGPTLIPPGTAVRATRIDHIGPGDRPPQQVKVDKALSNIGDFREWLTWSN
jgi:hypothetical protein